jgi:1-aminocyclopropane-1-carboxylate deaminase/D-cysteine desulfhydrase-like pyridoxal-dependent ACC family enzyme
MTEKEIFEKNLVLSTEFDRYVMEHSEFAEKIPHNALIVLLPADDPELCNINIEMAKKQKESAQQVVYIHIGGISHQMSRLKDVNMEVVAA